MHSSAQLIGVTLHQKRPAAQLLARAFFDDPLMKFVLPGDEKRSTVLPWLFGTVVQYCILYGEVDATPNLEGVACWLPPGRTTLTLMGMLRAGMFGLRFKLSVVEIRRFLANMAYTEKIHQQVALAQRHWYLWAVGVDPYCQGQGIGGRLLAPVLDRASVTGVPCYLETHNRKNLAFYEKHGFEVAREGMIPKAGPSVWAMVRKS